VHIVELSIAVVNVYTKVVNASLTPNECLQCVMPPVERDRATSLSWPMTAWSSSSTSTTKQNRNYQFFPKEI